MKFRVLGWPGDDVALDLDRQTFSYAGKFGVARTGKAVAEEDDTVVAAVSFSEDRTDEDTMWLRYVSVHRNHRGGGFGAKLARFVTEHVRENGYPKVSIAVNNVFSYEALFKAGFGFSGEEVGLAELVLSTPGDRSTDAYQSGLDAFKSRDGLTTNERTFLDDRANASPPAVVDISDAEKEY